MFMQPSYIEDLNVQRAKLLEHIETRNLSELSSRDSNERSIGIFWDMENCEVPRDAQCANIGVNILKALQMYTEIDGVVKMFLCYGKSEIFPKSIKEACQETGVNFINVTGGTQNSADKAIINSMFVFAFDNCPPASIMLISGDIDFAHTLYMLNQRQYTIILAVPRGTSVSQDLYSASKFVWDWPSLARGEGLVSPGNLDKSGKGHKLVKSGKVSGPFKKIWQRVIKPVQHNDIQTLKIQLMELLKCSGGSLPLKQLESKYYDQFREHLSPENYGERDLSLLSKMSDVITVEEKGTEKFICLHNKQELTFSTNDEKEEGALDDNIIESLDAVSLDDYSNEHGLYTELESGHSWEEAETSKLKEENLYER